MHKTVARTIISLLSLTLPLILVCADTIRLKNGSVIKGKVTTYNDREFTVLLDIGSSSKRSSSRLVLAVEDVESIQFDGNDTPSASLPNSIENRNSAPRESIAKDAPKTPASTPTLSNNPPTTPPAQSAEAPLLDKTVSVIAAADWTSTEVRIKKGQRITISATGAVDLGGNRRIGPEGTTSADPKKLIPNAPTGALIAVIGDDNDDFIAVGPQASFVAEREGILFLSVNESNLRDNAGSFAAKVRVFTK